MQVASEPREYQFGTFSAEVASCYYCGDPATTVDHVPPRCVRRMMLADQRAFGQFKFYELDCCKECNSALGKKLWTPAERKAYIGKWLQRRYRKILKMPDWSTAELAEISENLQKATLASLRLRDVVRRRVRWASPKLAKQRVGQKQSRPEPKVRPTFDRRCEVCSRPFTTLQVNRKFCDEDCGLEQQARQAGWRHRIIVRRMMRKGVAAPAYIARPLLMPRFPDGCEGWRGLLQ